MSLAVTLGPKEGDPAPELVSWLGHVGLGVDVGGEFLGLLVGSEHAHDGQVVFG